MPYIKKEQRPAIDKLIQPFIEHLKALPLEDQDGSLNYAVTKIIKHTYPERYFHYNRALGVLNAITHEFYRKMVGPYEETRIKESGEVD